MKISLFESELVFVGNINNVNGLVSILGCRVPSLPMKYLGLPLGASFKGRPIWDGIMEKIVSFGWLEDNALDKGWEDYLD